MKKSWVYLFAILPLQALAGVGNHDNRYYVTDEMWATEPYKKFVHLKTWLNNHEVGHCSAQYISKNLILSAGHCAFGDAYKVENYKKVEKYKHETFEVKLLETPYKGGYGVDDWAVFIVPDQQYYSDTYFDIRVPTETTDVMNAGWGWVAILSDDELYLIRKVLSEKKFNNSIQSDQFVWEIENAIDIELNMARSRCFDQAEQVCMRHKDSQLRDDCKAKLYKKCSDMNSTLRDRLDRLKASTCQILYEKNKFNIIERIKKFPEVLLTSCDVWVGNSGGGYISLDGVLLYGIVSYGQDENDFVDDSKSASVNYVASALQFDKRIKELIEYYNSHDYVPLEKMGEQIFYKPNYQSDENDESRQNGILLMDTHIQNLSQEKNELATEVISQYKDIKDMNNKQLLSYLNKVVEHQVKSEQLEKLEKAYRDARDKEQSTANKLLTAAAVAAGGLGGMEWAQGRAEQLADADAEREMSAYITTMKCEYSGGQQVDLGDTETLPGGNEILPYKTEFKQLAEKLKATKTALNLRPGIESEIVYDRAETGLYDYQTAETGGGANPSLSRALMNPDGTDATAWNVQKQESADKVQSGKTTAGIGVIGGAVGNAAINTDVIKNVVEKIRK